MRTFVKIISALFIVYFISVFSVKAETNVNKVWKIYSMVYEESTGLHKVDVSGSAVYLGKGKVLTNAHVVLNDQGVPYGIYELCITYDFKSEPTCYNIGDLEKYDTKSDLALLNLSTEYSSYPDLWVGAKFSLGNENIGDNVTVIGYPGNGGDNINLSQGKISGFSEGLYKTDADIDHGNSGGGAFNIKGELIGIPTAITKDTGVIGYIIPIKTVKKFLSSTTIDKYGVINQDYRNHWQEHKEVIRNSYSSILLDGVQIKNINKYSFSTLRFFQSKKLGLKNFILKSNTDSTYLTISDSLMLKSTIEYSKIWDGTNSDAEKRYIKKHINIGGKKVFLLITLNKKTNEITLVFEYKGIFVTIYGNLKEKKGLINALKLVLQNTHFIGGSHSDTLSFNGYKYGNQNKLLSYNYVFNNELSNITSLDGYIIEFEFTPFKSEIDFSNYNYEDWFDFLKDDSKGLIKNQILQNKSGEIFSLTKSFDKEYKHYTYYFSKYGVLDGKRGLRFFEITIDEVDEDSFESALKEFLLDIKFEGVDFITVKDEKNISDLNSFFR